MKTRNVDVAVIGAGSAGLRAYREAKRWTPNVVLIEGGPYGTTCARVGCMPSKLLIAAAEAAHTVSEAHAFGIEATRSIDGKAVMRRVRSERDRFAGFVVESTESLPAVDRIRGYARFTDDTTLIVDDHTTINAKRVVIATGSAPSYPAPWRELGDRLAVNDDIFDWQDLPDSVAVFGPGVIGLELGQALSRLGVRVHMFGIGGAVGPLTDPAVRASALDAFQSEFPLDPDANILDMRRVGDSVFIKFEDADGQTETLTVDYVVAATGRRPNVDRLGLENTSLPLGPKGIPVFDPLTLQIGDSPVFIAGDVNDDRPLLHEAADEGAIAGRNAARFPTIEAGERRSALAVVFSEPQIAMIGQTYAQLADTDFVTGAVSFENQGRSRVMLKNQGLLHVYADPRTRRLLGAEMVGPRAEHLAHLLAWAHQRGDTIDQLLEMPFYHPVIEEGLRTALQNAAKALNSRTAKAA